MPTGPATPALRRCDGNGNRTTQSLAGTTREYTLVGDKVTAAHDVVGTARTPRNAFAHDALSAVSEVGKYTGSSITSAVCLRHDPLGRLVLVGRRSSWLSSGCSLDSHVSEVTARVRYDGLGRRIARQEPATGVWTYFMHDPSGRLLAEATLGAGGWTPVREYVWLGGMPLAQVEYAGGVPRVYYLHVDHLGLPRAMTNSAGQAVWRAEARPYGDLVETTAPDPLSGRTVVTNLRLPGQYDERLLASVGLQGPYYNWNRWYLPTMGRYMELDPIAVSGGFNGLLGVDWYGYVEQNPLRWTDPTGLSRADILRIFYQFNKAVRDMTNAGQRTDPGWQNNFIRGLHNASGGLIGRKYLGCYEQAGVVQDREKWTFYDDDWAFELTGSNWPGFSGDQVHLVPHWWITATSSNPDDPRIVLDPWRNVVILVEPLN